MKKLRIVLYGHFGSGNIGNDSSFEAALSNIRQRVPLAEIICVCNGPQAIADRFSIKTIPIDVSEQRGKDVDQISNHLLFGVRRLFGRIIDEVKFWLKRPAWFRSIDKFIVVGTGAVDDMAIKQPWNAPYDLYKWCTCAKIARTKVIFLSVGVGPIINKVSRFLMLRALRTADYRSYREAGSIDYLQNIGFDTSTDLLYPDLVFSLDEKYLKPDDRLVELPKAVGVGLLNYYGWKHDPSIGESLYQEYISKIKQFIIWLLEKGYTVRLLRGDKTEDRPVDEVVEFVRGIGAAVSQEKLISEEINSVGKLFEQISQTDIVVASRFHNVLCSLMLERPVISVGYHHKNVAIMNEAGLGEYCQYIEDFTLERLVQQFESCTTDLAQIVQRIRLQNELNRQMLSRQYDDILLLSGKNSQ